MPRIPRQPATYGASVNRIRGQIFVPWTILDHALQIVFVTGDLRFLFRTFSAARVYYLAAMRAPKMRTHATRQGRVVALCDYCSNTIEFIGLQQAEEKVSASGWTRSPWQDPMRRLQRTRAAGSCTCPGQAWG